MGNNVFAHVPDINDFTKGLKILLNSKGTITLEFPHLKKLLDYTQFDTVYHEHFSYLSLFSVCKIFNTAGLRVFDVEELKTHGGSLRIYACHNEDPRPNSISVEKIIDDEFKSGMQDLKIYTNFQSKVNIIKNDFLTFLLDQKKEGKTIVAYGAAAKGCTFLNYAGIKNDLISYVCDASVFKQGKFLPGSHIPIISPNEIIKIKPNLILVLPWNIIDEIISDIEYVRNWGAKILIANPTVKIL